MKKFFTLLALIATCVTGAMAETWTVAGSSDDLLGTAWDPANTTNDMTNVEGTTWGLVKRATLEATTYEFKVCKDHGWTEAYPVNNYLFTIDEAGEYTIVFKFDSNTHAVSVWYFKSLTVAGDEELCGSNWNTSDANNVMNGNDGIYTWTYSGEELTSNVGFKIVKDNGWSESFPEENYKINGGWYDNITISFNVITKTVGATLTKTTPTEYYPFTSTDNGSTWTKGDALEGNDGIYTFRLENVAQWELFAVAPNTAWGSDNVLKYWDVVYRPEATSSRFGLNLQHYAPTAVQNPSGDGKDAVFMANEGSVNYVVEFNVNTPSYIVDVEKTINFSDAFSEETDKYATYSNSASYMISNAEAYYVSKAENGYATLTSITGTVPAGEGIIVKSTGDTFTVSSSPENPASYGEANLLTGTNDDATYTFNDNNYMGYILAKPEGKDVGFYLSQSGTLAAHKAFILSTKVAGANFLGFTFDDENTGISSVSANSKGTDIYNLAGQRQSQLQKGLNIVGGKKVLVK